MTRETTTKRRRFLQSAGLGSAALIAGCSALDSQDDGDETGDDGNETDGNKSNGEGNNGEDGNGDNETDGEQRTVGLAVSLNQGEQLQIQQISQQVQNEELSQEKATQQKEEIAQGAIDELATAIEDVSNVTVDGEFPQLRAIEATGDPAGLIDVLEMDRGQSMVSESGLEDAQSPFVFS